MWYYIDCENRVAGRNPNNMGGNTGWVEIEDPQEPMPEIDLCDGNGALLYKLVDGAITERTPEERAADIVAPPVPQDEVAVLREQVRELNDVIDALIGGTP